MLLILVVEQATSSSKVQKFSTSAAGARGGERDSRGKRRSLASGEQGRGLEGGRFL